MQMINNFGETLKELKSICSIKSITLANYLGYDISYISKWCANKKLPSGRNIIHILDDTSRIFSRELINNGKLEDFNSKYNTSINNIEELNDYIRTILEDSYDRSRRNEKILKREENKIIFGENEIISFVKTRIKEMIENNVMEFDMYITSDILKMDAVYQDKEFFSNKFPKMNIKVGCDMVKQDKNNFQRISSIHYLLSRLISCDIQVYEDSGFSKSNIYLVKNEFAILFSLDKAGNMDFGVVITDKEDLEKIYRSLKSKFDCADILVDTIKQNEVEEKKSIINFYNSDKFDFLFNVKFDFLRPAILLNSSNNYLIDNELVNLQEIIEKKLAFSNINIFINKDMFDDYVYSSLIGSGHKEVKETFNRIELLINYMRSNDNINMYIIDNRKFDAETMKYSLAVYGSEQFVMLKKHMNSDDGMASFYIIKNSRMINYIEEAYKYLMAEEYVKKLTTGELGEILSKYKKLV